MIWTMVVLFKIYWGISVFNLIVGIILTGIGFYSKNVFFGGTILNDIGSLFVTEAFDMIIISLVVFGFVMGDEKFNELLSLNRTDKLLYILFGLNMIYRFVFHNDVEMENGTSFTSDKLLAGIAISLYLNLSAFILSSNYIKSATNRSV